MLKNLFELEKGSALFIIVVVMAIGAIFTLALGTWVTSEVKQTALEGNQDQAYYVARSAGLSFMEKIMNEDIADLKDAFRVDINNDGLVNEDVNGDGTFDEEDDLLQSPDLRSSKWQQFGKSGTKEYKIEAMIDSKEIFHIYVDAKVDGQGLKTPLEIQAAPEGTYQGTNLDKVIFAENSIEFNYDVEVDSGGFGVNKQEVLSEDVTFNSTGDIEINGDVLVGQDTTQTVIDEIQNNLDSGSVKKMDSLKTYTLPRFPNFPDASSLSNQGNVIFTSDYTIAQDTNYEELTIRDSTLTILVGEDDRKIRINTLELDNGQIEIKKRQSADSMGQVKFYIEEKINFIGQSKIDFADFTGGFSIDATKLHEKNIIYYRGSESLVLGQDQRIVGDLYSQMADVTLSGTTNLIGYLVAGAKKVEIIGGNYGVYEKNDQSINSRSYPRLVYAPKSEVILESPASSSENDAITGAVVGQDVVVGPNFNFIYFMTNIDSPGFDFEGGRKYTKYEWIYND